MLEQLVILLLKRQRETEPLLLLLFGEVDFKRVKISGVVEAWESGAGQVKLEGEGDAGIERALGDGR